MPALDPRPGARADHRQPRLRRPRRRPPRRAGRVRRARAARRPRAGAGDQVQAALRRGAHGGAAGAGPGPRAPPAARTSASAAAAPGRTWSTPSSCATSRRRWSTRWSGWAGWRATRSSRSSRPGEIWGYRNKLEYSWSQRPDGPSLGFHVAGRWDRLMAVDTCHIASAASNQLRRALRAVGARAGLRAVRPAHRARAFCATWWCARAAAPASCWRCWSPRPARVPAAERLAELLAGAVRGGGARGQRRRGRGHGRARRDGAVRRRRVRRADRRARRCGSSAGAFMQTNTRDVRRALRPRHRVRAVCAPTTWPGTSTAAPARSGCWRRRTCERLVGVEISSASRSRSARRERRPKRHRQRRVHRGRRRQASCARCSSGPSGPSVVFVDPPRAGLDAAGGAARDRARAASGIVYVSCNPTTLAPNARQLVDAGYRLERGAARWTCSRTRTTSSAWRSSPRQDAGRGRPDGPHPVEDRRPAGRRRRRSAARAARSRRSRRRTRAAPAARSRPPPRSARTRVEAAGRHHDQLRPLRRQPRPRWSRS